MPSPLAHRRKSLRALLNSDEVDWATVDDVWLDLYLATTGTDLEGVVGALGGGISIRERRTALDFLDLLDRSIQP